MSDLPREGDEPREQPDRLSWGGEQKRWDPEVAPGRRLFAFDLPEDVESAWDDPTIKDNPGRPDRDAIELTDDRRAHLLDGDKWGGGHRHGTGRPHKTEFPADWSDEKIVADILDVARSPGDVPFRQDNGRWRAYGIRDGVGITVVVEPDGSIWTAWPREGSPGVVRNPMEGLGEGERGH